jgi:hypothetical protein
VRLRLRGGTRWFLASLTIAILHTHNLSPHVAAASFDFALANGGNRSVIRGASVSNPVTATRVAGSTRAVTFSASGLPAGALATFSRSSCSPTCSTTVTISTAPSTPMTTSTITITGTGGGRVRRTTFALTVTAGADTTAPTVSMSAPANNAVVAGTAVTVAATASDNAAVAGVQFLLDGASLGSEDTAAPYSVTWNTTTASNGSHVVSARARDASGNSTTAPNVNVVVDNQAPSSAPTISGLTASNIGPDSATITWTTDQPATSQVEYGAGTSFTSATPVDGNLVTAHTVVLTGLASNTSYVYRARSSDAFPHETVSPTASFTTAGAAGTSAIPTLIQHVTTSSNYDPSELGNNFKIHLADPALASNCIILGIRYPDAAGRTVTIGDNRGNAWLTGPTVSNNGIRSRIFYVTGVAAGTRDVTVTFDAKVTGFQAQISEFYNVAVNFALDGSSGSATSPNPAITGGSLTTSVAGDLVYNYVTTNDFGATITGITAGAGFTLLSADRLRASAAQYRVQSQPGAITPAMTVASASGSMNSLAIALKGATAGTPPPPGIRVTHVYHGYWLGSPAKLQFPSTGNLLVLATSFGNLNSNISSIASTPGNTWTKVTIPPVDGTDPQMLYAANATTGPSLEFAINASAAFVQFVIYDVTGASTAPFDGAGKASGNNASNATILGAPHITSTAPGLIIATLPMGHGPPVNCTAPGCLFDAVTYPGEADGSTFESSDGYAHLYHSTAGATSFDWQPASVELPSAWFALAAAFKSP